MKTWTATTTVDAGPEAVLDVLTDPDAVARWAPLPFDVEDLDTPRLTAGSRARVTGRLAGRRVGFDVEVHEAEPGRLTLVATGPIELDVAYDMAPAGAGSEVRASVCVRRGKGLTGRLMAEATNALLSAGALTHAVSRLAREAAVCPA
jgi:carbon monoxide dehydrogenase subunit G